MKYDVFISYSRKDYVDEVGNIIEGNIVTQIKELLTSNGYTYWFDETGLIASLKNHYGKLEEQQKLRQEEDRRKRKEMEDAEAKLKEEEAKNKRLVAIDHEIEELRVILDKKTSEKIAVQSNMDQFKKKINECLSEVKSIEDNITTIHATIEQLNKEKDSLLGKTSANVDTSHKNESDNLHWMVKGLYLLVGIVSFVLACYFVYNGIKLGYTSAITAYLAFTFSSLISVMGVIRVLKNYRDGFIWLMISIVSLNILEFLTLIWTKAHGRVNFTTIMSFDRITIIGCSIGVCVMLALPLFFPRNGYDVWSQMKTPSIPLKEDRLRLIGCVLFVLMALALVYNRIWPYFEDFIDKIYSSF